MIGTGSDLLFAQDNFSAESEKIINDEIPNEIDAIIGVCNPDERLHGPARQQYVDIRQRCD
jgi:hypothetical protein